MKKNQIDKCKNILLELSFKKDKERANLFIKRSVALL